MNTPVTHAECIKHMEDLENRIHQCIKAERIDYKEAIGEVKEWVGQFVETVENRFVKIEGKIDYMVFGVLFLALEGIVGLVIFVFTLLGGHL